jgi:hypothetical protein
MSQQQDELQRRLGNAPPMPQSGPWNRGQIVGSARQGADFGRLGGGFGNADTDSLKHTFGRVAQNFDTSDAGLQAMVQDEEFKRLFPNARLDKDWIDFGGQVDPHTGTRVGKIDVQRGWVKGGRGGPWQWLTEEDALGASNARQGDPIGKAPLMTGQSDLMAQILSNLQGMQQPDAQALLLQQLSV